MWVRRLVRTLSSPRCCAGWTTVTGPSAFPTAPICLNQASRAKSYVPGSAIGGGGARRALRETTPPGGMSPGEFFFVDGDPDARRKRRIGRGDRQADHFLGRQMVDRLDLASHGHHRGAA